MSLKHLYLHFLIILDYPSSVLRHLLLIQLYTILNMVFLHLWTPHEQTVLVEVSHPTGITSLLTDFHPATCTRQISFVTQNASQRAVFELIYLRVHLYLFELDFLFLNAAQFNTL